MSDAIRELHDYLAKSPSVIYPEDVLAYLPAIEAENAKLRELVWNLLRVISRDVSGVVIGAHGEHPTYYSFADAMREL